MRQEPKSTLKLQTQAQTEFKANTKKTSKINKTETVSDCGIKIIYLYIKNCAKIQIHQHAKKTNLQSQEISTQQKNPLYNCEIINPPSTNSIYKNVCVHVQCSVFHVPSSMFHVSSSMFHVSTFPCSIFYVPFQVS